MRIVTYPFFLFFAMLLSLTFWSAPAQPASPEKKPGESSPMPIVINSKALEADNKNMTITFTGDVEAKREDFTVYCQQMVVYYEKPADKNKGADEGTRIDKIVATGDVKIVRSEGGVATGKKAVYYQRDEKLVLTGQPVVKQGDNSVEGDRITLFLKEDRSVVESSGDKKVRAVIFSKQKKQQGL